MSELNQADAALVVIGKEVTVTGAYLTKAGEETFTEKFIVPLEHAEKALVSILTREEDSLKARLLAADATFRGIRTHIVANIVDALGPKPAPVVPPAPPLCPTCSQEVEAPIEAAVALPDPAVADLTAKLAEANAHLASDQELFDSLNAQVGDLKSQIAALSQSAAGASTGAAAPALAPEAAASAPAASSDVAHS